MKEIFQTEPENKLKISFLNAQKVMYKNDNVLH